MTETPKIRIWHHSFTVLENLPPYAAAMAAHLARASAPGSRSLTGTVIAPPFGAKLILET